MTSKFTFGIDSIPIKLSTDIIGNFYISTTTKVVWVRETDKWAILGNLDNYIRYNTINNLSDSTQRFWDWIKSQDGQIISLILVVLIILGVLFYY